MIKIHLKPLLSVALAVAMAGCAGHAAKPAPAPAETNTGAEHAAESLVIKAQQALLAGRDDEAAQDYVDAASKSTQPEVAAQAAALAWHAGDAALAKQAADRWLTLAPQAAGPHHFLALLALHQHDLNTAAAQFEALLKTGKVKHGFEAVAGVLAADGSPYEGLMVMRKLEAAHTDNPAAEYALAQLAARADHTRLAREKIEHSLELKPNWLKALMLRGQLLIDGGQPDQAVAPVATLVKQSPHDVDLKIRYSELLFDAGRGEQARQLLQGVLKKDIEQPEALLLLAMDRLDHGKEKRASRYLTRLLETGKRNPQAYFYLGELAARDKDYRMALDWFQRIEQQHRTAANELAIAATLVHMDKLDAARKYLDEARQHYPEYTDALTIGEAQLLSSHEKPNAALDVLNAAIKARPDDTGLLYARSMLAEQTGHHQQALGDVKRVVQLEPENTAALNALGYMLTEHSQHYQRARQYIKQALSYSPHNAAIIDSLGWVEYRLGDTQAALDALKRAHRLDDDPEISAHLVAVLRATGARSEAQRVLKQALKQHPDAQALKRLESKS
ncbi:MAG TPA: tetratricopeptide repeat protein [Gammaproteobacteria bacterium]|nr:tetratricopeptide repeat protein [Gammaproteobacteria bacterium]